MTSVTPTPTMTSPRTSLLRKPNLIRKAGLLVLVAVLCTAPASTALAQSIPSGEAGFVNEFFRPGRATNTIYVWGAVGAPGIWKVEEGIGLMELLAAAQLQGTGVQGTGTRTVTTIRVRRTTGNDRRIVYEERLDDMLEAGPDSYPTIRDRDVVEVNTRTKRRFGFQAISTVVGTVSSVALLTIRLIDFRN